MLFSSRNIHQAVAAIEIEAEEVFAVAQIQRLGLLARLAAAHPVGVANAMVCSHQMFGDGIRVGGNPVIASDSVAI